VIFFLLSFLNHFFGVKAPALFYHSSTRMVLAALTTLFCTLFLGPRVIKRLYELKTGQSIRVENCPMLAELHEKKKDTPSMGGVLMLLSMLIALVLWMDLQSSFTLILMVATVWLGVIGGYDDYLKIRHKNSKGLKGKKKLIGQLLFSFLLGLYLLCPQISEAIHIGNWFAPIVAKGQVTLSMQAYASHYYMPFMKEPFFILTGATFFIGILSTAFVVTGASNAVNLTDGLDGLAAGCLVMVSAVLALVAFLSNHIEMAHYLNILYIEGSEEIAVYMCALIGSALGFLWYNGYPAQVFMGDIGSLSLGGVLGVAAVLLRKELLFGMVSAIFVVEALSVIIQVMGYRLFHKKRVFLCAPLHHHFEYKGWPETKVVLRFWIIGLLLAMIGLISLKLQ